MAKAIPLQLAGRDFAKKGDALLHVRARLQSYSPGQRVADEDEALLRALLARHPDSACKTGSGVTTSWCAAPITAPSASGWCERTDRPNVSRTKSVFDCRAYRPARHGTVMASVHSGPTCTPRHSCHIPPANKAARPTGPSFQLVAEYPTEAVNW